MTSTLRCLYGRSITRRIPWGLAIIALMLAWHSVIIAEDKLPIIPNELREYVHPDVRYARCELNETEDAYILWAKAIEEFGKNENSKRRKDFSDDKSISVMEAELWLQENETALALLDRGIARGKCQFPPLDQGYHTLVAYLGKLIALADVKLLRAKVRMREGQFEKAAQDLTDLLAMSELIANADGGLVHLSPGRVIDQRTTEGIAALLRYPQVSSQILQQLLSAATFSHDPVDTLHDALQLEMECFLMFTSEWPENLTDATETDIVMGTLPKGMKMPQTPEAGRTNIFSIVLGSGTFGYHKALLSGHPNALDKPATVKLFSEYLTHYAQAATLPLVTQQTNEPYSNLVACKNELDQFWNSIPTTQSNRSHFIHLKGNDLVTDCVKHCRYDDGKSHAIPPSFPR